VRDQALVADPAADFQRLKAASCGSAAFRVGDRFRINARASRDRIPRLLVNIRTGAARSDIGIYQ
jgi:hypothetical protein